MGTNQIQRTCSHAVFVRHIDGWDGDCDESATAVVLDDEEREWWLCAQHADWDPND